LAQSFEAAKLDGVISIIGFLAGGREQSPSFMEVLSRSILTRGVRVSSRMQFEDMVSVPTKNLRWFIIGAFIIELSRPIRLNL
jgi:threonine dehydrogenase-like Zn-dependent dehydrogenase